MRRGMDVSMQTSKVVVVAVLVAVVEIGVLVVFQRRTIVPA